MKSDSLPLPYLVLSRRLPMSLDISLPSCGCANHWIYMRTSDHANPSHMNLRDQTLTSLLSAKTQRDCIQASSVLKMMAIAQLLKESSLAKVRRELSAKHLIWQDKRIANLFMW